jgi:hypothetical protein
MTRVNGMQKSQCAIRLPLRQAICPQHGLSPLPPLQAHVCIASASKHAFGHSRTHTASVTLDLDGAIVNPKITSLPRPPRQSEVSVDAAGSALATLVASGCGGSVSKTPPGLTPSVGIDCASLLRVKNGGGCIMWMPPPKLMPSVLMVGSARAFLCAGTVIVSKPPPKLMPSVGISCGLRAGCSGLCATASLEEQGHQQEFKLARVHRRRQTHARN